MCGIVGYVGFREASDVILDGLKRLEYRGYDSAGIAVKVNGHLEVVKKAGKLQVLADTLKEHRLSGQLGVGHTRWATHGAPTDPNAHPHATEKGDIVVIHNGIIENYLPLKEGLIARGHTFTSETDSEVLAHLIEEKYRQKMVAGHSGNAANQGDLVEAVRLALAEAYGAYALVVAHQDHEEIVVARTVSPLVIGLGEGENFVASDVPALLPYTRRVIFLHDGDMAVVRRDGVTVTDLAGNPVEREVVTVEWSLEAAEKGGHPHYMLKEIYEQPRVLENTLGGRLHEEEAGVELGLKLEPTRYDKVHIVACGTAYYAAWVGKYLLEALARVPVEIDVASEYRYRDPVVDDKTLAICIRPSIPWRPSVRPSARARAPWGSSTPRAAASPARWTTPSISTLGRRSGWPLPRPTSPCWPLWLCWRSGWAGPGARWTRRPHGSFWGRCANCPGW